MYMQDINNDLQWKQFPCYNLQNGLICTCHQGGEGEGKVVIDIGGANAESPDFGPPEADIYKKTVRRLSHFGENKAKDFTCYTKRIFTFSSEVFSLTCRKALSSSSSSSSLLWMAFLKLEENWNQMIIRNCLKPFLFFYKSHNSCILNITITRATSEE